MAGQVLSVAGGAAHGKLLTDDALRIIKIFLHISPEEQLRRFEERLKDPMKRWKLSYEDFRNRKNWQAYVEATDEMLAKTSTKRAPWHVVAAENKKWARVESLRIITERLAKGVDLKPRPLDERVTQEAEAYFDTVQGLIEGTAGRSY